MRKTKPIRNQRKVHCRLRFNRPCPSVRVENEAKWRELTLHAPPSTLHASPRPWPVNPEGVASRRKRGARHRKMCKTKPIRNQRKVHCCMRLNHRRPSLRVENEANPDISDKIERPFILIGRS